MKIFLEKTSTQIGRLSEVDMSHQHGWASFDLLGASIEQKGRHEVNSLSLFELRAPPSPDLGWTSVLLVLRPSDTDHDLHRQLP